MWNRLSAWYSSWNEDMIAVLVNPALADKMSDPSRRCIAAKLLELTPIERLQLHHFCITYQGATMWKAIARLTVLFSCFGAALYLIKPGLGWPKSLFVANLLGWILMFVLIGIWFNYRRISTKPMRLALFAVGGVLSGIAAGSVISALTQAKPIWDIWLQDGPLLLKAAGVAGAGYLILIGIVASWRNQSYETINAQLELEAEREKSARQSSESQLRLLRAQIEPHFLFNTLGAIQQLAEQGAPKAAELTANLIHFLRASMSEMRAEQITLADEFAMLRAYLDVMQVRLAQRLQYSLDLPAPLAQVKVPSMVLLTLAENAIKHGIEPALRGGTVTVTARQHGDQISIVVQDSGVGLSDKPGSGIGLQNVRDRLRLAYGAGAGLSIAQAGQGGVIAHVTLPCALADQTINASNNDSK